MKKMTYKMTYEELLQFGVKIFNFSPDEDFKSIKELLDVAAKSFRHRDYLVACGFFFPRVAMFLDQEHGVDDDATKEVI